MVIIGIKDVQSCEVEAQEAEADLLQLWARVPAKQSQTELVGTTSTQPSDKLQGYINKDNKENMDPKKNLEAPLMEASQTADAVLASHTVSQVHTSESLVLHDLFQSRSLLPQYSSGMLDADGSISIHRKGGARLDAIVRVYQSNLAFHTAINAEIGYTGYISTHSVAGTAANMNEGRYSKGELRQKLTFVGKAAGDVAAELQPYTVTKAPHIEILLGMLKHRAGPPGLSAR
ncbi:TPA: hypothetical protein ACH3X1_002970 [Trebouxia sp. C0004]